MSVHPSNDFLPTKRRIYASSSKNVMQSFSKGGVNMPSALPLNKISQICEESYSPMTKSTQLSSNDSYQYCSEDEGMDAEISSVESPMNRSQRKGGYAAPTRNSQGSPAKMIKTENGWKKKVKTELCRFWLNGQACENSLKDQGCGFAHGQEELQKKKGLSRQYLTSVCKNFLEHPSKCTYGQRCIFQHPTFDVRKRQKYTDMVQDNARYTAMRLFQDIEGSEVIYINTYAATAPRLAAFRNICSSAKDNGEDYVDEDEDQIEEQSSPSLNRGLFRAAQE